MLLAGGESRRMGTDKATLQWNGHVLWEWQLEKLRVLAPRTIFISARSDPRWRPADVQLVIDSGDSHGPVSGIASVLEKCESPYLLVLAIDLPLVPATYLKALCRLLGASSGVVPNAHSGFEPLAAIYPREARDVFEAAIRRGDYALQPLIRELIAQSLLRTVAIAPEEEQYFRNMNQPADLALK